jgi:hypothetical protein
MSEDDSEKNAKRLKLIAVSTTNYDSLRKFGEFGDSFNDVITKLLDRVDMLPNVKDSQV